MKRILPLFLILALSIFGACHKQQTDAERQAEIDREVERRLDAEHQGQQKDQLDQRERDVAAREQAFNDRNTGTVSPVQPQSDDSEDDDDDSSSADSGDNAAVDSYDTFYKKLDSDGDWRETDDYGYVFQPREAQAGTWRPYTDGRWVYTDAGWTWISEEHFGWACYHYGRWVRLRKIGWVWIPGSEWAPAWVSWRKSNDYVGWAPLPPEARFDRRKGIHNWADNYYDIGPEQYCFVPTRDFGEQRIVRTVIPAERNVTIINQTINVTNITFNNRTVVNQGPDFEELRTRTQRPIERLRLERNSNLNVNAGDAGPVIRGDVVAVTAPVIKHSKSVQRPPKVKETVAHVAVDRGWENVTDHNAANQFRAKVQAEATPPPDAPARRFVRRGQARADRSPQPATSPAGDANLDVVSPTPMGTPLRAIPPQPTSTPVHTPTVPSPPLPPRQTPTPLPTITPSPVASATPTPFTRPFRGRQMPVAPDSTSSAPPNIAATPLPNEKMQQLQERRRNFERMQHARPGATTSPAQSAPPPNP